MKWSSIIGCGLAALFVIAAAANAQEPRPVIPPPQPFLPQPVPPVLQPVQDNAQPVQEVPQPVEEIPQPVQEIPQFGAGSPAARLARTGRPPPAYECRIRPPG